MPTSSAYMELHCTNCRTKIYMTYGEYVTTPCEIECPNCKIKSPKTGESDSTINSKAPRIIPKAIEYN